MDKKNKTTKKQNKFYNELKGLGQLFVVGSIVYSTFVVTRDATTLQVALVVPQALYAVTVLVSKFKN